MIRSTIAAAALGTLLLSGCATMNLPGQDDGLVERVRSEIQLDGNIDSTRITVTERDGAIVLGGFANSLQDIEIVQDLVSEVEGVAEIENQVVVQAD